MVAFTTYAFRSGVLIQGITSNGGVMRIFDGNAVVLGLTSLLVFLAVPKVIVHNIAIYCLGRLSAVYRRALMEPFNICSESASLAMREVVNHFAFTILADVKDKQDRGENPLPRA